MKLVTTLLLISTLAILSCKPKVFTPKPRGYFAIALPNHAYTLFSKAGFPYQFEYPSYGSILKDTTMTTFMKDKNGIDYWINVDFPQWNARIYLSYKNMKGAGDLEKLLNDAHELSFVHTKKADYINEPEFHNDSTHVHGVYYDVGGNAASAIQFFATDSNKHYLRGALYFNVTPNADSLQPMVAFLSKDIEHLIKTLRWK